MDLGEKARNDLRQFVGEIDVKIAGVLDEELNKKFGFNVRQQSVVAQALEHSKEYILRPTKRIRSAFVTYGYMLGAKKPDEKMWRAAVGVELVHAALLMHDDFMDKDATRRGGPSTHVFYKDLFSGSMHFGESMAVTVGDALLCTGFELVGETGDMAALKQLLRGITNTAYGQAYDVSLEALREWTEEDVLVLHQAKTAIYTYENPLFIGAHLAKLPKDALNVLQEYSTDGGVAFQLQDDILGVFGTPEKTGKSADSDLRQGKCTLLVLKAIEKPEFRQAIEKVWGNEKAERADLDAAKQAIVDSGSLDYSRNLAKKLAAQAAKSAEKLRKLNLNSEAIDFIQGVAEYMVNREV